MFGEWHALSSARRAAWPLGITCILIAVAVLGVSEDRAHTRKIAPKAPTSNIAEFERLSIDLRGQRLTPAEESAIGAEVQAKGQDPVYERYVDTWLTKDALKRYVGTFLRPPPMKVVTPDAETFFHRLSVFKSGDRSVYFLPHTVAAKSQAPCTDKQIRKVSVWWQKDSVEVCSASYKPETIFDEVGYCAGESEPLMRQPPRAGCGCGPQLMGCLPPLGENQALEAQVSNAIMGEWQETAARIVDEGRPLDELITTSRTWQSGLVQFLYARRDVIALLRKQGWSDAVDKSITKIFAKVDPTAPGTWVQRKGIYKGSGLWWTSQVHAAMKIPVRPGAHHMLARHLCTPFTALNVDAHAVLSAVGDKNQNLRSLSSIAESPMRFQDGCKGCHQPMDGVAGFMSAIEGPMYGSYPTGRKTKGEFYVKGDGDLRGKGKTLADLGKLIVKQPEFEVCSVRRAMEEVYTRPIRTQDNALVKELIGVFKKNGHRWKPVLRTLLLSPGYRNESGSAHASTGLSEVPPAIGKLLVQRCAGCHDEDHSLDLRSAPPVANTAAWKGIMVRLAEGSMPPPSFEGDTVSIRFPLDPEERERMVRASKAILGPAIDKPVPVKRTNHKTWLRIAHEVGDPVLGADEVARHLGPVVSRSGLYAKVGVRGGPPPYLLGVERASESMCRAIAAADGAKVYGIASGTWSKAQIESSALALLNKVFPKDPRSKLPDAVAFFEKAQAITGDAQEAWTALCSTQLTSPALFFGAYVR